MKAKILALVTMVFLIFTSFMNLNAQWARTYREWSWEIANSIQQTSDGGYIVAGLTGYTEVGDTDYNFWVLKLTPTGTIEWEHSYGGTRIESPKSIQQTSDGGYIVAGYTDSFGAGDNDFWVLKLDSTGIVEWQKTYGDSYSEIASSIQETIDGGYIVAGSASSFSPGPGGADAWVLKITSAGDIVWQRRYDRGSVESASSIHQTSDGGYIVAGKSFTRYAGENDFWILKLTSIGDIEWQHIYGGIDDDEAHSIRQTGDGGYIVAGFTASFGAEGRDFWVLKLIASGEIEWQRAYGAGSNDSANSIQQTIDGGYIIAGAGGDGWNVWALKFSSNGHIEWERIYDWDCNEEAHSIQQTSDGGYVVAGTTAPSCGNSHFWVLKLLPDGTIDPTCGFIRSSEAIITDTFVSPKSTSASPQDTNIAPLDTGVISQDTNAYVVLVCDGPKYDFTISVTAGGTTYPSPGTHTYYIGTVFRIEALADIGYRFSYWTGDVPSEHENDNPITITMDSDKSIEANFIRQYTLTIVAGRGGTTDPSPSNYMHDSGTEVTIKAIPLSGYEFTGWSGDASGTTNPITITMDSDKSVTAYFKKQSISEKLCFIATAAYDSPLHPHVKILQDFRDKYLMPSKLGRTLVNLYYRYSPFAAEFITKHKALRIVVRINLLPLVAFSYSMLHLGPVITAVILIFIFIFPIFLILFYRRKMRQVETKKPKAWLPWIERDSSTNLKLISFPREDCAA